MCKEYFKPVYLYDHVELDSKILYTVYQNSNSTKMTGNKYFGMKAHPGYNPTILIVFLCHDMEMLTFTNWCTESGWLSR